MPTHNDETLLERYQREAMVDERIEAAAQEREHTPPELAEWLVELAQRCSKQTEAA